MKKKNKKALVIVAHCDDVVLWMGGIIRHLRDWEWHIFSMCNSNIDSKIQSFNKTCEALGAKKFQALNFLDYQDDGVFFKNNKKNMRAEIEKFLDKEYDYVFTHGMQEWNEYGHHDNHQEVAEVAQEIAKEKSYPLIQFCYYPIYGSGIATVAYKERANYYFQLNYEELKFKLELINCFPQEMGSLVNALKSPCPNPEGFESSDVLPTPPFIRALK